MNNPTGQDIVNGALTALGILEQGGTPSTPDSNDALSELNLMWQSWSIDEGLIWQQIALRLGLTTANQAIYSIGSGAQLDTPVVPARIYQAVMTTPSGGAPNASAVAYGGTGYASSDTGVILGAQGLLATYTVTGVLGTTVTSVTVSGGTGYQIGGAYETQTGGGQPGSGTGLSINITGVTTPTTNRNELKIVNAAQYYMHNDLAASAAIADEIFPDYNPDAAGWAKLRFWPVPSVATLGLELLAAVAFNAWSLTANYVLDPGYQDAIQYALAWRLIPRYGAAISQQTVEMIGELATKAEARIRDANAKNRQLPAPVVQPAGAQPTPAGGA